MSVNARNFNNMIADSLNQLSSEKEPEGLDGYALEETVKYINHASTILKCTIVTRAKALLIHHCFRKCVHETRYDPYMVAAACISLSMKYNEEPMEFDAIILVFFRMLDQGARRSTQSEEYRKIKKSLTLTECLILRMINFSLNHVVAHEFLAYYMNDLHEELSTYNVWHVFSETCMRLASDFYLSNKCLNYKAEEIAVTVVQVSLYLLGVDVNSDGCHLKIWLTMLNDCPDTISLNIVEDIFRISDLGSFAESQKKEMN